MWELLLRDLWFYLINIFAFAAVGILVWLRTRQIWLERLASAQMELASLRLKEGDILAELEDKYKDKEEHLRLVLLDLMKHWKEGNEEMARARRNEVSNLWILEYRRRLSQYVRMLTEVYTGNRDKQYLLIENHLLPFLQMSGDLLETLNQEDLLALTGSKAMVLQYQDFDFIFDFTRLYLSWFDWSLRRSLKKHRKRLGI